ncbi:MAG: hypothetical protein HOV80_10275 [Polyangiaceae bacterium]|nr:hypothetical protein [Polyangiaceae bacterium]
MRAVAAAATFGMIGTVACAAYGQSVTETPEDHCDSRATCAECLECATPHKGGGNSDDAQVCAQWFDGCFGDDRECTSPSESSCCEFTACRAACEDMHGLDSSAAWLCICGSSSRELCRLNDAGEGTCVFEHSEGAARTLGINGWQTCVYSTCESLCGE